jgi:hypothetical protein
MFRLLSLLLIAAFAVVWVEARWEPDAHSLTLRLRDGAEIRALAFAKARDLGKDWVRSWLEKREEPRPAVGASAPEPAEPAPSDELTPRDRSALDRLVRERVKP